MRTHFEVLGLGLEGQVLGLEVSSPRKLACPRFEDFFELLKFREALEKFFGKRVTVEIARKIYVKTFFFFFGDRLKSFCDFGEHLRLCPWSLASSIPVLGLESVCPRKGCPWPWPRFFFVSLTPPLVRVLAISVS